MLAKYSAIILIIALVAIMMGNIKPAFACTCNSNMTVAEKFKIASEVLIGKITDVVRPPKGPMVSSGDYIYYTLNVSKVLKGSPDKTAVVRSAQSEVSCGYEFRLGNEYLVYAVNKGDQLETGLCYGNKTLSNAQADLEAITNDLVKEAPEKMQERRVESLLVGSTDPVTYLVLGVGLVILVIISVLLFRGKRA